MQNVFQTERVKLWKTPGNFSDLNCVKSLWNIVKQRLIKHECTSPVVSNKVISTAIKAWYYNIKLSNMCNNLQSQKKYLEQSKEIQWN